MSSMSASMERLKFAARNDGASKVTVHADDLRHLIGLVSPSVDTRIAELTAEVASLNAQLAVLNDALKLSEDENNDLSSDNYRLHTQVGYLETYIASNALKEG